MNWFIPTHLILAIGLAGLPWNQSAMGAGNCWASYLLIANADKYVKERAREGRLSADERERIQKARADRVWQAVHEVYRTPNRGGYREAGGRDLGIPESDRSAIDVELNKYLASVFGEAGAKGDFFALGNKGHLAQHEKMNEGDSVPVPNKFPNGALQDVFGIKPEDANAIMLAHDNKKQLPDLGDPIANRGLEKIGPGPVQVVEYVVGLHGHESLRNLAEIIQRLGKEKGWPQAQQESYFYKYADAIGGHNFGLDLSDLSVSGLQKKYPSLNAEEAVALSKSFYDRLVNQGGQFGPTGINARLDFPVSDRDIAERSPLSRHLIHIDRGTILDWKKVGSQDLATMDFGPASVETTLNATSTGALALVKAVADVRKADILPGAGYWVKSGQPVAKGTSGAVFKPYTMEDVPSYQYFMSTGKKWQQAAALIRDANTPARRQAAGLSDTDRAVLYRANGGEYLVGGDYTREGGKKIYSLKLQYRASGQTAFSEIPLPTGSTNPMEVLGSLMTQNKDLE